MMFKKIYVLSAKEEGPNTYWSPTLWENVETARKEYPEHTYKEINGEVKMLAAKFEGPNTFWALYDDMCPREMSVKDFLNFRAPVDMKRVYVDEIPQQKENLA